MSASPGRFITRLPNGPALRIDLPITCRRYAVLRVRLIQPHDHILNHGLDQPILGSNTGYFQVIFPSPVDNLDRPKVSAPAPVMLITPAIEAQLNERQKRIVWRRRYKTRSSPNRRCEQELKVTRDITTWDFSLLMNIGLAKRQSRGRSTSYIFAGKP